MQPPQPQPEATAEAPQSNNFSGVGGPSASGLLRPVRVERMQSPDAQSIIPLYSVRADSAPLCCGGAWLVRSSRRRSQSVGPVGRVVEAAAGRDSAAHHAAACGCNESDVQASPSALGPWATTAGFDQLGGRHEPHGHRKPARSTGSLPTSCHAEASCSAFGCGGGRERHVRRLGSVAAAGRHVLLRA